MERINFNINNSLSLAVSFLILDYAGFIFCLTYQIYHACVAMSCTKSVFHSKQIHISS